MELQNQEEFEKYVKENYELVFTSNSPNDLDSNKAGHCDFCQKDAFLRLGTRWHHQVYSNKGGPSFCTFFIQCPSCLRQSFLILVILSRHEEKPQGGGTTFTYYYDYYKVHNIPTQEFQFETKDIPEKYELLKKTVIEAKYVLQHSQFTSATIMFRRALQILAKNILGAKGKTLFHQLEWLKENENTLKINLSVLFHDNSKLIREVGNQGAHPEEDVDLQVFSKEDAHAVHDLFLILVNEIFVLPARMRKMKEDLIKRRKLNIK